MQNFGTKLTIAVIVLDLDLLGYLYNFVSSFDLIIIVQSIELEHIDDVHMRYEILRYFVSLGPTFLNVHAHVMCKNNRVRKIYYDLFFLLQKS